MSMTSVDFPRHLIEFKFLVFEFFKPKDSKLCACAAPYVQAPGHGAMGEDRPLKPISTSTLLSRELLWEETFYRVFNLSKDFFIPTGTRHPRYNIGKDISRNGRCSVLKIIARVIMFA